MRLSRVRGGGIGYSWQRLRTPTPEVPVDVGSALERTRRSQNQSLARLALRAGFRAGGALGLIQGVLLFDCCHEPDE